MLLAYQLIQDLPRLAWCAKARREFKTVQLLHGPWVETTPTFFTDGAWAGEFSYGDFEHTTLAGFAGRVSDAGLLLATPTNTVERLYVMALPNLVLASNSLAFLLAEIDDSTDPDRCFDGSRLASVVDGLHRYVRSIRTRKGRKVRIFYHCNVLVTPDLQLIEQPKLDVRFNDFGEYHSYLRSTVDALVRNARDIMRAHHYTPIATISTGYDSPTAATLARLAGCREAITIRQSRNHENDSGEVIARALDMQIRTYDRDAYKHLSVYSHLEALIEGGGYPSVFAAFGAALQGRLLFTGFHGDKVWDRNPDVVGPHIVRGDSSGSGLTEYRLREGFIHLPVPFIGCTAQADIHKISNAREMSPWTLGNDYDRPIARRIVEEAGVPRAAFGHAKRAIDVVLREEGGLAKHFDAHALMLFDEYCYAHWSGWKAIKSGIIQLLGWIDRKNKGVNHRLAYYAKRYLHVTLPLPRVVPYHLRALTHVFRGRELMLFHWAIHHLMERYNPMLSSAVPEDATGVLLLTTPLD